MFCNFPEFTWCLLVIELQQLNTWSWFHRLYLKKCTVVAFDVLTKQAVCLPLWFFISPWEKSHLLNHIVTATSSKEVNLTLLVQIPHPTQVMVKFPTHNWWSNSQGLPGGIWKFQIGSPRENICIAGQLLSVSALSFFYRYGFEFLEHTYLYHVTRKDVKHNFSVYFYMMYLVEGSRWSVVLGLASFIPQLVLTVVFGIVYYRDISFCCFVQTFAFVTFNKVCTSQVR